MVLQYEGMKSVKKSGRSRQLIALIFCLSALLGAGLFIELKYHVLFPSPSSQLEEVGAADSSDVEQPANDSASDESSEQTTETVEE